MLDKLQIIVLLSCALLTQGCEKGVWNNPYPELDGSDNTLYTSFSERPKHLDPAVSYTAEEWIFINQIYEAPLQYHYLKRPYELVPLIAQNMPDVRYIDVDGKVLPKESPIENIAFSIYQIKIKPGIYFQAHPAFARKKDSDEFLYDNLTKSDVKDKHSLLDFPITSTRELVAEDFVYQIKRLADPTINSPILGLMENYIVGIKDYSKKLQDLYHDLGVTEGNTAFLDLRQFPLEGVTVIDKYTYEIKIHGKYPQFLYWLAMPFYAPMPWEAVKFYSQKVLLQKNISLDWFPVGTGPFILTKNNPNSEMILSKNPNFHGEKYPSLGEPGDKENGLLTMAGKNLPFLDKIVFILEKESIPYWSKFLQGYYDQSGVSAENFDQVLNTGPAGSLDLTKELSDKGIRLNTSVQPTIFYWGFNMTDEVVGGYTQSKKKLRQAISMVVDMEEYINIFLNGNGIVAQGPLPPSIFGFNDNIEGKNKFIYNINSKSEKVERKSIEQAKKLLAEAGFPDGIDPKTNQPLVLYFDAVMTGGPESSSQFSWIRKQFKKLGIELVIRATQYNRFQDKMQNGDFQIYHWGWNADYPDPENFLFLLYGKNGKVKFSGENASNYENPAFDILYEKMKSMENTPERARIIDDMLKLVQEDAPWIWGFHPKIYVLRQGWVSPFKTNAMSRNTLKYMAIDPELRARSRIQWNQAIAWPLLLGVLGFIILCIPAVIGYWRKMHKSLVLKEPEEIKE